MNKTTSCRQALQTKSVKTTRRFTAIPANTPVVRRSLRPAFYYLIQQCRHKAWCEITHADLAEEFGVHPATAARWIYGMIEQGAIVRVQRRSSRCWSLPNRYRIPHLEGFFESVDKVSNYADQTLRDLNTNTTATREAREEDYGNKLASEEPTADATQLGQTSGCTGSSGSGDADNRPPIIPGRRSERHSGNSSRTRSGRDASRFHVSYHRLKWEHNRFRNHPPAMRELYERNGSLMAENRLLRDSKRIRNAMNASIGSYNPNDPYVQEAEARAKREIERVNAGGSIWASEADVVGWTR